MHRLSLILLMVTLMLACSPTVKVEPPEEPITINLNVKIEHDIRVKVDKELEDVFSEDSELF
ncbi:MAG: YnbE family lipoprotein [Gammaproteobacteria bacterium]